MTLPSPWDEITADDLPNDSLREVARKFGLEVAVGLWRDFGGSTIELPKRLPRAFCVRYLSRHWNGRNLTTLARRLDVTRRTVYEYLSQGSQRAPRLARPTNAQTQLTIL